MLKNYFLINTQTNICENIIVLDSDAQTWIAPEGCLTIEQTLALTKVWEFNKTNQTWELVEKQGLGDIGYIWDGINLITNEPMPTYTPMESVSGQPQPESQGAQTI